MEWYLALKGIAKAIVLPPAGPIIVAIAGLLLWKRAPRAGRALAALGTIALLLLSMPVVAWLLMQPFDREPLDVAAAREAQAIVIIGGGTRLRAREYGGDTLGRLTLERVRYGARVAKQLSLPVLVSAGRPMGASRAEADVMADALADEFGVPVRWREQRSRNTHENAQLSARILKQDGVERIVLVAHAIDMPRACAEFAAAGITAIPAATGLPVRGSIFPTDFVPQIGALVASRDALYELLANLVRVAST